MLLVSAWRRLLVAGVAVAALWGAVLWVVAAATMVLGTVVGVVQNNIKRMLAYSSIAHGGYLLVALLSANDLGKGAVLFYLLTYAVTNLGAFGVIGLLESARQSPATSHQPPNDQVKDYAGLWYSHPVLAGLMTVFLLSMAGIPPTGGFLGKYLIFQAAVQSKQWMLAIVGSLNAVIAAYYYLSVILTMWFKQPEGDAGTPSPLSPSLAFVLTISAAAVLYLGIAPDRVLGLIQGLASTLI